MNRRGFLRSIALGAALAMAPMLRSSEAPPDRLLITDWIQTSRTYSCYSQEYIDTLFRLVDKACGIPASFYS